MGKGVMFTMRGCLRWITNYPFLVFLLSGLIFMYMSSPFTFSLLVSASPVLVCAAVLVGTLLFYGKTKVPKIEVDEKTSDGMIVAVESDPMKDEKGKLGEDETEWENENYERFAKMNVVESWEYEKDEGLDSGWEEAESSSSDESMSDVMPMLDELHPLLNEDSSQLMSRVCSEAPSERTSISSVESVDNEDDEGGKKGGKVIWTEEDEKNVMELGCSEIERNKRLENLLMRRRRMNRKPEINLMDLDTCDFPYNIPHISTARHNPPFDLPHHPYFDFGLPPLPSSAPPVLLPRRNPFDMPCQANPYHRFQEELKTSESREAFFRRQEHYPSVLAPNRPETQDLKWGPIFIPQQIAFELGTSLEKKDHNGQQRHDHPGQSTCDMMSDTNASVEVFPCNDPVYDSSPNAVKTNSSSSSSVSSDHLTNNGETPSSQDDYVEANEKLISTPSAGGIKPHFHDSRLLHEHLEEEEVQVQVQVQVPNTPVESREEVRSIQNIHIPELHDQLEINETKQGQVSNDMHLETCMDDEKDVKPNSDARLTQSSSTKSQENAKETSVNRRFSTPF